MKKANLALSLATAFVILVAIFAVFYLREQGAETNDQEAQQANIEAVLENELADRELERNRVSLYLENNISELSPEAAVLGGTFFITEINYRDDNTALVSYEDGHIALQAKVVFEVDDDSVTINSFDLLEQ